MTDPLIVKSWKCLAAPEREACATMAAQAYITPFFVFALSIDAIFEAQSDIDPVIRREAWEQCTSSERVTIGEPPLEVVGYFATDLWCRQLADCQILGGCQLADPLCQQLTFINSPE